MGIRKLEARTFVPDFHGKRIEQLYYRGLRIVEIAEILELYPSQVSRYLDKTGLRRVRRTKRRYTV